MLRLEVGVGPPGYDSSTNEFVHMETYVLELEHSLVSLSKWECSFLKPFLSKEPKTQEELIGYVRAMSTSSDVPPAVYENLDSRHFVEINEYINRTMTAATFRQSSEEENSRPITNELIYSWMFALNIPMACEHWHLNRLFTLLRVCSDQQRPPKELTKAEKAERIGQRARLNAQRKAQLGTTG